MPRRARKKSDTNIYHVVIRGLDRQVIFEKESDYIKYLQILEFYKEKCGFDLYAYCLMANHIHLILKVNEVSLETIFRKINTHYAVWFNLKYKRTGHLQQGRFYSEPINDERNLFLAIRYVHQNPIKAGLEPEVGQKYRWSSIHEYRSEQKKLVDIELIYCAVSAEDFLYFNKQKTDKECLDVDKIRKRMPDDVAKSIILEETQCETSTDFQKLSLVDRDKYIKILKKKGLSVRQINRLTGVPKRIIENIKS